MVLRTSPVVVFQILIVASQEAEATLPEVSVVELPSEDMTVISSFRSTQSDEIHPLWPLKVLRHNPVAASQIYQRKEKEEQRRRVRKRRSRRRRRILSP
jgi:hypothetical protein